MSKARLIVWICCLAVLVWSGWAGAAAGVSPWGPMNQIETEARKEGQLMVYAAPGHTNAVAERVISQVFKERYGVDIQWLSVGAQDIGPRILTEQRTKQYLADIVMTGFPIFYSLVKPRGYVEPVLAPSTFEEGVWRVHPRVMMPEREFLLIRTSLIPGFLINTSQVPEKEEPKGYQDLLHPKWKGRIVLQIPWVGGSGSGWFQAAYKKLGLDYMKALSKQVALVPNVNDVPDAVARGAQAMGIAASTDRSRKLIGEGAPLKYKSPAEGSFMTPQGLYLITNRPHPSAAKLFLHWFYTREGQEVYAKNTSSIPLRKDASQEHIPPDQRFVEGQPLMMAEWPKEDLDPKKIGEFTKLAEEIFGQNR